MKTEKLKALTLGLSLFAVYLLFFTPTSLSAQVNIGQSYNSPVNNITDVGKTISTVAANLYLIAGIICFVLFMWGGFEYIRGAGSDDRDAIGRGKRIIFYAILGFLIIFASYWIIRLVELLTHILIF